MIEEIAHLIFGPAGAVAAIVMLDSLGGKKKTKAPARSTKPMAVAPLIIGKAEEKPLEQKNDNVAELAPKSSKKRKSTATKETQRTSNGRTRKKIVSADKKAKSKTTKRAAVTAHRSKSHAKKSKKAA
jgi:hypothetical protein